MLARGTKAEIIAHLIEHCQRLMELPLGFLEVDDDVYVGPSESEEVVRTLTARFSTESLLKGNDYLGFAAEASRGGTHQPQDRH